MPIATHDDQNQGLRLLTHTRNCVTPCMLKRRLSQKKVLRFRIPPIQDHQDPSIEGLSHPFSKVLGAFSSPCLRKQSQTEDASSPWSPPGHEIGSPWHIPCLFLVNSHSMNEENIRKSLGTLVQWHSKQHM